MPERPAAAGAAAAAAPAQDATAREAEALRAELAVLSRKYALATRGLAEQSRALAAAAAAREGDAARMQQLERTAKEDPSLRYKYERAKRVLKAQAAAISSARRQASGARHERDATAAAAAAWRADAAAALADARGAMGSAAQEAVDARTQLLEALGDAERLRADVEERDIRIAHMNAEALRAKEEETAEDLRTASGQHASSSDDACTQTDASAPAVATAEGDCAAQFATPQGMHAQPLATPHSRAPGSAQTPYMTPMTSLPVSDAAAIRGVEYALLAADSDAAELHALREELSAACEALGLEVAPGPDADASRKAGTTVSSVGASAMLEALLVRLGEERREVLALREAHAHAQLSPSTAPPPECDDPELAPSDDHATDDFARDAATIASEGEEATVPDAQEIPDSDEDTAECEPTANAHTPSVCATVVKAQSCAAVTPSMHDTSRRSLDSSSPEADAGTQWGTPAAASSAWGTPATHLSTQLQSARGNTYGLRTRTASVDAGVQVGGGAAPLWASTGFAPSSRRRSAPVCISASTQTMTALSSDATAQTLVDMSIHASADAEAALSELESAAVTLMTPGTGCKDTLAMTPDTIGYSPSHMQNSSQGHDRALVVEEKMSSLKDRIKMFDTSSKPVGKEAQLTAIAPAPNCFPSASKDEGVLAKRRQPLAPLVNTNRV